MDFITQNMNLILGAGGAAFLLWLIMRILSGKKKVIGDEYKVNVQCRKCKWQGTVTKYNMTCRKCAGKDLDTM